MTGYENLIPGEIYKIDIEYECPNPKYLTEFWNCYAIFLNYKDHNPVFKRLSSNDQAEFSIRGWGRILIPTEEELVIARLEGRI